MSFAIAYHLITTFFAVLPVSILYAFTWRRYRERINADDGYFETRRSMHRAQAIATFAFTLCAFDFLVGLTVAGIPCWYSVLMIVLGVVGAFIATAATLRY